MKNKIVLFCLIILGLNTSKAHLSIHPQFGVSMNKIKTFNLDILGNNKDEIQYLLGFQGGVGFDFKVGDVLSIEPILRYNQKGYTEDLSYDYFGINYSRKSLLRLHYIELPIMANFNMEMEKLNMVFTVGPYLGYCVAARGVRESVDGTVTESYDSKNDNNFLNDLVDYSGFNRTDVGLNLGIRAEISNFTVGLSGAMSMNNVFSHGDANKHLNFQFNAGYKIELD